MELCEYDCHTLIDTMNDGGWSADLLKQYVEAIVNQHAKLDDSRFEAIERANKALSAQAQEYRAAANEWRAALNDAKADFLTKAEYGRAHDALTGRCESLEKQQSEMRGRMMVILVLFPAMVTAVIGIMHIIK